MSALNRREESLVPLLPAEPKTLARSFETGDGLKEMIVEARSIVSTFEHDMSTPASRQKTSQLAYRVARLKTAVDKIGKGLVDDIKARTGAIDKRRKLMRDALDDLKAEARAPLDEWEAAEAAEKARIDENIAMLLDLASTVDKSGNPRTMEMLQANLPVLCALEINSGNYGQEWEAAGRRRNEGVTRVEAAIDTLVIAARQRKEAEEATRKAKELQAQLDAERLEKQKIIAAEERAKRQSAEQKLEAAKAKERERLQAENLEKLRLDRETKARAGADHMAKVEAELLQDLEVCLEKAWEPAGLLELIKQGQVRHLKIEY